MTLLLNQQAANSSHNLTETAKMADSGLGYFRNNIRRKLEERVSGFNEQWYAFADSWNHLVKDDYMGDGGEYRYRRYAVFTRMGEEGPQLLDDQRHYQARSYNDLNGGIYREYPCFAEETIENPVFKALLQCASDSVRTARPDMGAWRFETHQFRIVASADEKGRPVPEGIHQDGVDYVFVFLIDRVNVRGGVSRIYKPDGHLMSELKLRHPGDFMVVNDRRVLHYVTPIYPRAQGQDAHRDVLVITVRGLDRQVVEKAA